MLLPQKIQEESTLVMLRVLYLVMLSVANVVAFVYTESTPIGMFFSYMR